MRIPRARRTSLPTPTSALTFAPAAAIVCFPVSFGGGNTR